MGEKIKKIKKKEKNKKEKGKGKVMFHLYLGFCAIEVRHAALQQAAGFAHHPSLGAAQGKEGRLCNFILCPLGM